MKAKVLMLTLMGACALTFSAQAQEEAPASQQLPGRKTVFNQDKPGDHWFIDIQGGAVMMPLGEANNQANFMDRIGWGMPNVALGKWYSPYFACRGHLYGWGVPGFEFTGADKTKNVGYTNYFAAGQLEFMFDMVNYFGVYNPKTVFHFIPFVGVGVGYKFETREGGLFAKDAKTLDTFTKMDDYDFSAAVNAGVIFKFRLGRRVDLNLEAQCMAMKANFAGSTPSVQNAGVPVKGKTSADLLALLTAGLSFNLGTPEFTEVVPMDWALVNDLNGQISNLRAENAELSKRPVSCPPCPEAKPAEKVTKNILNNVVYFRIGSAKIDQNQKINIYNTAEYAKNNNEKIYVTGYADEQTGSADFNMGLSERRANAVKDILVNEYGIDESRIVVDAKGSSVQPFERNEWNRVVIMTAE